MRGKNHISLPLLSVYLPFDQQCQKRLNKVNGKVCFLNSLSKPKLLHLTRMAIEMATTMDGWMWWLPTTYTLIFALVFDSTFLQLTICSFSLLIIYLQSLPYYFFFTFFLKKKKNPFLQSNEIHSFGTQSPLNFLSL